MSRFARAWRRWTERVETTELDPGAGAAARLQFDTERLSARLLAQDDETLFCSFFSDAETMRHIGPPLSAQCARRSFRAALLAHAKPVVRNVFLILREKSGQTRIGLCTLQNIERGTRRAEVGLILTPQSRNRGYAQQAVGALVGRAFGVFSLNEIWVCISEDHAIAQRILVGLGFARRDSLTSAAGHTTQIWSVDRATWRGHTEQH